MKANVVGIRKSQNAKGEVVVNLYVSVPFEDWEAQAESTLSCSGSKTTSEYIRKDINVSAGDIVELSYKKGFGDKAVLDDVTVLERKKDPASATK